MVVNDSDGKSCDVKIVSVIVTDAIVVIDNSDGGYNDEMGMHVIMVIANEACVVGSRVVLVITMEL